MIALLWACTTGGFIWDLPAHFPPPRVPEANPMTEEKIGLGRRLFHDPRLSIDQEMSCATCHQQALAFTDGRPRGVGTTGEVHPRGAMSLANVAWAPRLAWANPLIASLEVQAMLPMFGEAPVEMGMSGAETELIARLQADADYPRAFAAVWPEDPITVAHVTDAIACFERTLVSADSPYDRYIAGDAAALGAAERRGMELFFSERLECFHCHGGFNFTDALDHAGLATVEIAYHNTGLYDLDGAGAYPAGGTGLAEITEDPADMGRFKAPTLRNIAVTSPYMHDGSVADLAGVLDHYAAGGRAEGSPLRSEFVSGFILSPSEKSDVIAFLHSLTDQGFLTDPAHADPGR